MQAILYDVFRRYFQFHGKKVTYVRNYTDVDDKIIQRANELGIPPLQHSEQMIRETEEDLSLLGVQAADVQPKVSDHIEDIIQLIEKIVARGSAYASGGDVYFRVRSDSHYGCLSNRHPDDMRSGARIDINTNKEDPLDFTLWKAAKPGEIAWDSPWGPGRPGWHIECSALSQKYLGETFDIHGGGKDLIFPHHENEITQSRMGTDGAFARFWIHNGLVTVEGRKMSKSLNNFLSIREAVARFFPETIRYTILRHHYRANIDFSEKSFYDAYQRLIYLYQSLLRVQELEAQELEEANSPVALGEFSAIPGFVEAMDDDFNTARALAHLEGLVRKLNDYLAAKTPKLKQKRPLVVAAFAELRRCFDVLGLLTGQPREALDHIRSYLVEAKQLNAAEIESLVLERENARAEKDWTRADALRTRLLELGVQLMDSPQGTEWQVLP
jgi:cysteinyl-tRNA synthetase